MATWAAVLAAAATVAAASPSVVLSGVAVMSQPSASAAVTWGGIVSPSTQDWIAVTCSPSNSYAWWYYATGSASGAINVRLQAKLRACSCDTATRSSLAFSQITLWANGLQSNCNELYVAYYDASSTVVATSNTVGIRAMIQHVHLHATSDPTMMVASFVTSGMPGGAGAGCYYGTAMPSIYAPAQPFVDYAQVGNLSYAFMTGLSPNTSYTYFCTDGSLASEPATFLNRRTDRQPIAAVFADFGVDDGFGINQIAADAAAGAFDLVIHAGDFAYDLDTSTSAVGNFFLNRASSSYAATHPVQVCPGNHEAGANFSQYKTRFASVAAAHGTGTSLFYSFDYGLIHWLAFNSETYIDGGIAEMLAFMQADLASVNRSVTPWVVAYSHKWFWMDNTDWTAIAPLLKDGGVDVLIGGHWHYYQRYVPFDSVSGTADMPAVSPDKRTYTDPQFLTTLISGAPGDIERNDACPGDPTHSNITAACSSAYGYGQLQALNASHLHWTFTGRSTPIGSGIGGRADPPGPVDYTDELWIVRSSPPGAA